MELYQLKTFITVAEEAHLTRAANRLNISQPSVSAHIKMLEEEFGITLFERSKKGMRLTDKGEFLLQKARTVLNSSAELLKHAENIKGEAVGALKIGININSDILKITHLFERTRIDYPKLNLKIFDSSSHQVEEYLRSGEFDCGYILGDSLVSGIMTYYLRSIDYVLAGPVSWKEKLMKADTQEIASLPWVVHSEGCRMDIIIKKHFNTTSKNLLKAVEAEDETMSKMIMAGAGLGLMYKNEAKKAEKEGKVVLWPGRSFSLDLFFAYPEARKDDQKIVAMLKTHDAIWRT